jgi:hypothetical protein
MLLLLQSGGQICKINFQILSTFAMIYGPIKIVPICDWMNQIELNLN